MNPPRYFAVSEYQRLGQSVTLAAATTIPAGNLVARDANGHAVLASNTAGLTLAGVARGLPGDSQWEDRTVMMADDRVNVSGGIFRFANSGTSPVTADDLDKKVLVEDERTVARQASASMVAGVAVGLEGVAFVWLWVSAPGTMSGDTKLGGA